MTGLRNDREYDPADVKRFWDEGHWNGDTITTWLERWANENPDGPSIIGPDGTLTHRQVYEKAQRMAGALLELGLKKGEAVGIQLTNTPEFLLTYYGVAMAGGVLLTMHMPYRAGEMEPLLNHGKAKAVVCEPPTEKYDAPAMMHSLKGKVPTLEHVLVAPGGEVPSDCVSLKQMIDNGPIKEIPDAPKSNDPVLLCFTSGTSAAPKAVLRTYDTSLSNGRIYGGTIEVNSDDRAMIVPPFTHVFGLCCLHNAMAYGAPTVLIKAFTPELFVETVERDKPTLLFSSPAPIAATLKSGLLKGPIPSMRYVVLAGSIVPPVVSQDFEEYLPNGRVGGLFGMTEIVLVTATSLDGSAKERHHSTGKPTKGVEVRVSSTEDGRILGPGEEGELEVRAYCNMSGYLNNPEANQRSFTKDNFFKTGDLAIIDEDRNVQITGRAKDIINRGGVKINPTDIENLVAAHPKVVLAAIAPMPDDILGEKACLFVTVVAGETLRLEEVTSYLGENNVAKLRWPEKLIIVDDMPMTPTKKVMKHELSALVS
ncbi:MAG: acyl--CoA ligase [Gammaproteobacteria bacterium]|nr:acyl--CoA ligase [Gammaproteobacteria bacterium]